MPVKHKTCQYSLSVTTLGLLYRYCRVSFFCILMSIPYDLNKPSYYLFRLIGHGIQKLLNRFETRINNNRKSVWPFSNLYCSFYEKDGYVSWYDMIARAFSCLEHFIYTTAARELGGNPQPTAGGRQLSRSLPKRKPA